MATVVLAMEGVLTEGTPQENTLNYESSSSGRVLYSMIQDTSRVLLLSIDPYLDRVKAWLARERFSRYADVHSIPVDTMLTPAQWKIQHVKDLMGIGHHIAYYIDSDPAAVQGALEAGVGAILVATPGVVPGKHGPDHTYSSWYDLVDTIEEQSMLRASKVLEAEGE